MSVSELYRQARLAVTWGVALSPDAKRALGLALFSDARLSSSGTVTCGNCHSPVADFQSNTPLDVPARSLPAIVPTLPRHTPSLTNIVLQAQIVERQVDPASPAAPEVHQLIGMVQQTLEATKSFIFDVRPMVLDDLGLMPTLRRAARERASRSGTPVDFESMGADRRLSVDLESGLFRMVDEAIAAFLTTRAERIAIKLDWSDQVEVTVSATRTAAAVAPDTTPDETATKDLPPALAAMMEERRAAARDAVEAARREAIVVLPPHITNS